MRKPDVTRGHSATPPPPPIRSKPVPLPTPFLYIISVVSARRPDAPGGTAALLRADWQATGVSARRSAIGCNSLIDRRRENRKGCSGSARTRRVIMRTRRWLLLSPVLCALTENTILFMNKNKAESYSTASTHTHTRSVADHIVRCAAPRVNTGHPARPFVLCCVRGSLQAFIRQRRFLLPRMIVLALNRTQSSLMTVTSHTHTHWTLSAYFIATHTHWYWIFAGRYRVTASFFMTGWMQT